MLGFDAERSTDHGWGPRLLVSSTTTTRRWRRPSGRCSTGTCPRWPARFAWDAVSVDHAALCSRTTAGSSGVSARLAWYPDPVWRWLVACQWRRLAQEEALVQRTAEVGDEVGSAMVAITGWSRSRRRWSRGVRETVRDVA